MKTMILAALLTMTAVCAQADIPPRPHIEPGPEMVLDAAMSDGMDLLLLAKSSDIKTFQSAGNTIRSATQQNLAPGVTRYTLVRQQCAQGGIAGGTCLGGARLVITVTNKRKGSMVQTTAVSSVALIRGL